MNIGSANTLTINASLFSAGNQILISQYGAGQTTITAGAGVFNCGVCVMVIAII